jgi:2-oxoisovalerate dehydrogenase E2 component (dihydrolipoyl transacylase)
VPDFLLPDLGEGLDEAEVVAWRVQVGEHVTVDQVIAEVETAKAVVEVPVPYAGTVARLHAEPGTTVSVGHPLVTVTADEPASGFREPGVVTAPASPPAADSGAERGEESSGNVLIGYGTTSAPARRRRAPRRGQAAAASAAPAIPRAVAASGPGPVAVISPLVRKMARDAGLDLRRLAGTGPAGVVSRADVRHAIAERADPHLESVPGTPAAQAGTLTPAAAAPGPVGPAVFSGEAGERRIPLRGARRAAADKLSRSRREIPEATVWVDVDATGLVEARRALNARPRQPVSLLALLGRFAIVGLRRYPELNARIEADEIVIPGHVHLGFAAQTEHGLVVPVVHDADRLTTRELSARLADRTVAARERRLGPADLSGGTFTVNNYGVFGVDGSAAIINHPEVAILGMGRVIDRPWVVDGQLTVRKVTELTLAFDHRACDGGTAGGFLRYVADCIESPAAALGDM